MPRTKIFLLVLTLLIAAAVVWFRFGNTFPEWLSIVLSVWIFLVGPVVVFSTARLARQEIHFEDPRGVSGAVLRVIVCTPLGCFGIIFLITGLAVIALALWLALTKGDFEILKNVPGLLVFAGMTAFGWFVLRRGMKGEGQTRKQIEEAEKARVEALLQPDWAFYEEHLRRPIPEALKRIYDDPDKVLGCLNLSGTEHLEYSIEFEPLHRDYLVPSGESNLPFDIVPIATTEDESQIFLKPGENETNQVLMVYPEGPVLIVPLADSVESFLSSLTAPRPATPGNR